MKNLPLLIEEYQAALLFGSSITPAESTLYATHESSLRELKELLAQQGSNQAISELLERERRSYGWSYLSGTHGEKVEQAFNALADAVEEWNASA